MEIKIREDITDCKILILEDECKNLMECIGMDLNFDDALEKMKDLKFIKNNFKACSLKKIMANKGIKPSVSSLRAEELFLILFNRVKHTIDFRGKKTYNYNGVIETKDNRYVVVIEYNDHEIPIGIFNKKKEAAVIYDTIIYHLTKDKSLMNFPDSNRKLSSLNSKLSKYTMNMLNWMDIESKPQKDLIHL